MRPTCGTQNSYCLSLHSLKQAYGSGALTPQLVIRDIKTRIENTSDDNIWIHVLDDEQLSTYLDKLQDKRPDELPLYGIPFAIKDNIDLAGVPTTAACPEYAYIPEESAHVVQRLLDAGAIPVGKTNLDQFATGLVGTRSPYGETRNSFNPEYIAGGSSSGSAVAVARGLASFALGTDTAGSGRVPAAFNNLIGVKPSRGLISMTGVIPACRSLDCVSLFALNPDDAASLFAVMADYDERDPYAREAPGTMTTQTGDAFRFGVVRDGQLAFFGNDDYAALYRSAVERLAAMGGEAVEIDFAPFMEAAALLYEGPWVAERYAAIRDVIEDRPEVLFPVTRRIIEPAMEINAVDAFEKMYRLQTLKRRADRVMGQVDFIVTPTAGNIYKRSEIAAEPVKLNSNLGYYTNFMNLLDYSAAAIPGGFDRKGLPFGITLFAPLFADMALLGYAGRLLQAQEWTMGATPFAWSMAGSSGYHRSHAGGQPWGQPAGQPLVLPAQSGQTMELAVCGAHMSGMPLNHQLIELGARLIRRTKTSSTYRLYALAGGPPYRPGMVRDESAGASIEVEVWSVPEEKFGAFMKGIPAPLGIGRVELADATWCNGFICEAYAIMDAGDITRFGSWRTYIASLK